MQNITQRKRGSHVFCALQSFYSVELGLYFIYSPSEPFKFVVNLLVNVIKLSFNILNSYHLGQTTHPSILEKLGSLTFLSCGTNDGKRRIRH